jgi:hypothetical protein
MVAVDFSASRCIVTGSHVAIAVVPLVLSSYPADECGALAEEVDDAYEPAYSSGIDVG